MKTPHKHATLIKAWADGAQIELWLPEPNRWEGITDPSWDDSFKYRIKPEFKPDVVKTCAATEFCAYYHDDFGVAHNLKLTFDGQTGDLKAAEVLP
jgi:hypothetical protein